MANDLTANPLKIDTAFTTVIAGSVFITGIVWTGRQGSLLGASEDLVLRNRRDELIFQKRTQAAGDDAYVSFPQPYSTDGLYAATIDNGICLVYA